MNRTLLQILSALRDRPFDAAVARRRLAIPFGVSLLVATLAVMWFGYVATREWTRSADSLLDGHAREALELMREAVKRDMAGAAMALVVPITSLTLDEHVPDDLFPVTAKVFASFPYPESFLVWKDNGTPLGSTYVFNRADRRPSWDSTVASDDPFPVVLLRDPPALRDPIAALRSRATAGHEFARMEAHMNGIDYEIVAHFQFSSRPPYQLVSLAAFTVNMRWLRDKYFVPVLSEILTIGGNEHIVWFAVIDDRGVVAAASDTTQPRGHQFERHFQTAFIDPALIAEQDHPRDWTLRVIPVHDRTYLAALRDARRTFVFLASSAFVTLLALMLTVRAVRSDAALASMKSDFVSAVTHELKTPLSLIRLVGDTLTNRRYSTPEAIQDYARLLSKEASRLGESIDTLLTYARYGDPRHFAQMALLPSTLSDIVEDALERFRPTIVHNGFDLRIDIASDLRVLADRSSLSQVIDCVIDNAIKYSDNRRALTVIGRRDGGYVHLSIADRGKGIPPDDLAHVCNRFYRGGNARESGSGLGLAIARNILTHHRGGITIRSTVDVGTEVELQLIAARES